MYDVDENGMIDLNEMTRLVKSIFKVSQSKVKICPSPSQSLFVHKSLETKYEKKIISIGF